MKFSIRESLDYSIPSDPSDVLVGRDPAVNRIAHHAERAAQVECTVLITGDTGTGKEVWARLLHRNGPRHNRPFVPVNCAALTPTLAESQLFGHIKGAFTGASGASLGVFRSGDRGIVFLDEVGDMPLELQPKLLRVLQEDEVTPVGAAHPERIDVQIIAATNRNLEKEVAEGRFREDLYYRLNLVELHIPPLRERAVDIPDFINFFSQKYAERYQQPTWIPNAETLRNFCEYRWPGNIRQLSYVIEQGYVLEHDPILPNQSRIQRTAAVDLPFFDLAKLRKAAVEQAMRATGGHKGKAASLLGIHPNTMTRILTQKHEDEVDCKD
jgi:DNA-binding NtrC family response regulator